MLALGYVVQQATGNGFVVYAACAALTCVTAYHGAASLFAGLMNIGSLLSSQTILWFALPFSYIGFFGYDRHIVTPTEAENIASVILVVSVCTVCFFLSEWLGKPIELPRIEDEGAMAIALLAPIVLVQFFLIWTGQWGYSAVIGLTEEQQQPIYVQAIRGCAPAIAPICAAFMGALFAGHRRLRRRAFIVLAASAFAIFVQISWWAVMGRRAMTVVALISAVTFFAYYFRGRMTHRNIWIVVLFSLAAIPATWFLWEAYYTLRLATNALGAGSNLSIFDLFEARRWAGDLDEQLAGNSIRRPFLVITSLTVVRETVSGALYGWNFISQALLAVPSAFFPGKFEFIGSTFETLWHERLGVPARDWSNTVFVESYTDFGALGFPIYVLAIAAIGRAIQWLCASLRSQVASAALYFILAYAVFSVETTTNSIFVLLRSALLIWVAIAVLQLFLRKSGRLQPKGWMIPSSGR